MVSIKFVAVLLLAFTVFCTISVRTEAQNLNVLEVLNASFSDLHRIVITFPELVTLFSSTTNNITVFAPVNGAFNNTHVDNSTLLSILEYHVSGSRIPVADLQEEDVVYTLYRTAALGNQSQVLLVSRNSSWVTVNGVRVNLQDIPATNGIVHGIASVLMPPSTTVSQVVSNSYATLSHLLSLSEANFTDRPLTLFAPTDAAFQSLPSVLVNYLSSNTSLSRADLTNILEYHALPTLHYTAGFSVGTTTIQTFLPSELVTVDKPTNWPNSSIVINDVAKIVNPDLLTSNGVVHGIDGVLVPSTFNFDLEKAVLGLGATTFWQLVQNSSLASIIFNDTAGRTLFVPTNAALNSANLSNTSLLYHAVAGSHNESVLETIYLYPSLLSLSSLSGKSQVLKFFYDANATTPSVYVNGAALRNATATTSGSYVYLIDSVLYLPPYVPSVLHESGNFSSFLSSLDVADLSGNVTTDNSLTIFAPTNNAFELLPPGTVQYLLNTNISGSLLSTVLENHIVYNPSAVFYSKVIPFGNTTLVTLTNNNATILVNKDLNGAITVNGAMVVDPDLIAANGVVHGIDQVLIPAGVTFSLENIMQGLGNFSRFIHYLNETGLLGELTSPNVTIFAPDDEAFDNVEDLDALTNNMTRLTQVLSAHVVHRRIPQLHVNQSFPVSSNFSIVVIGDNEVELRNSSGDAVGSSADIGVMSYAHNGNLYGINHVLGVQAEPDHHSGGLKTWEYVLIIVGGIVVGLLLLALLVGAGYFIYNVYYKNKQGYRKIND